MKIFVQNDLFGIAKRLKKIDKNYFVLWDTKKRQFEIHTKAQKFDSFCFSVDDRLDAKALRKAHETCTKNCKKIFEEIERNNKKIKEKEEENLIEKSRFLVRGFVDFCSKKKCDYDFSNLDKTKWF